jgi:protease-4
MPWQEWTRRFVPEGKEKPDFLSVQQLLRKPKKSDSQIAVLYAEGGIGPSEDITAEDLVPVIEKLAKEEKVKAVVLRVNSPGGAVLDSDKISRALRTLKAKKPLIVSMGGVAASGGYYISAFSDKIVAEPTTITGSIGVIGVLFDVRELLEKHVELRTDRVRVGGRYADFMSPYREASPEETQRMQAEIEGIYEEFLGIVREARRYPSRDAVHQIAQGRVWSGVDAREIGLVDTLGGLEAAIQIAAQKASLQEYVVVSFPEAKPFFQKWLKNMESVLYLFGLVQSRPILPEAFQARWPEEVKIY